MIDPIADMLNRIRNAQAVNKETVVVPFSKIKFEIAKILETEGYIGKIDNKKKGNVKILEISLKYRKEKDEKGREEPIIAGIKRVSRAGQRIYAKSHSLKPVLGGYGTSIVSTSKGLMTEKQAKKQKLGGEVLCEVW